MKNLLKLLALALIVWGIYSGVLAIQEKIDSIDTTTEVVTTVASDTVAPVITESESAVSTITLNASELPDFTTFVTATDDVDGEIVILASMVDSSALDVTVSGTYDIIFTVADSSGNEATLTYQVTVGA